MLALGLNNLAFLLRDMDAPERALQVMEEALAMYRRLYPEARFPSGHPEIVLGLNNLATMLESARDFEIVILLPRGVSKSSTADVYGKFDQRAGERGFEERALQIEDALGRGDLVNLPKNDLASSHHAARLEELGAFRADVSGAGPAVYGLFHDRGRAEEATREVEALGRVWVSKPGW